MNEAELKKYKNLDLLAKQLVEGFITGLHKSPFHGFSVEFAEHKHYNLGESTRHIDWKVYGKTDKLYTKRYEEETNLRCQILIDCSSSMYYPDKPNNKIDFSIKASAALTYLLQKQRDAVGLYLFNEGIDFSTLTKSTLSHRNLIFSKLAQIAESNTVNKGTQLPKTLHTIAEKIHKRSLVVIFSDFFDQFESLDEILAALQHFRHNNNELIIFHVSDHSTEKDFNFKNRNYEFIDLESGEKLKVKPNEIKKEYTRLINRHYNDLKLKCGQLKIDFIDVDIAEGFEPVFMAFLQKRKRMSR